MIKFWTENLWLALQLKRPTATPPSRKSSALLFMFVIASVMAFSANLYASLTVSEHKTQVARALSIAVEKGSLLASEVIEAYGSEEAFVEEYLGKKDNIVAKSLVVIFFGSVMTWALFPAAKIFGFCVLSPALSASYAASAIGLNVSGDIRIFLLLVLASFTYLAYAFYKFGKNTDHLIKGAEDERLA